MHRIGIDIMEIHRIEEALSRGGDRFLNRIYTEKEREFCRNRSSALAGRFAAKEAVMKVLGTGLKGIKWLDIETLSDADGMPVVHLHGNAKKRAEKLGLQEIVISVSHSKEYAVASAMGGQGGTSNYGVGLLY